MHDTVEIDAGTLNHATYLHVIGVTSKVAREPNMAADQLSNISSQYGYYYGIMVRAKRLLDDAVEALEGFKAESRTQKRQESGKLTAVAAEDYVRSLQGTSDLINEINRLKEGHGYAKGICNSLEMKKDMLVQLSANTRQESKLYQQQ